jgi:hypothetical protein
MKKIDVWSRREAEVVAQVKATGGLSHWWITEHAARAQAIRRLITRGVLKLTPRGFPWNDAEVIDLQPAPATATLGAK